MSRAQISDLIFVLNLFLLCGKSGESVLPLHDMHLVGRDIDGKNKLRRMLSISVYEFKGASTSEVTDTRNE